MKNHRNDKPAVEKTQGNDSSYIYTDLSVYPVGFGIALVWGMCSWYNLGPFNTLEDQMRSLPRVHPTLLCTLIVMASFKMINALIHPASIVHVCFEEHRLQASSKSIVILASPYNRCELCNSSLQNRVESMPCHVKAVPMVAKPNIRYRS